MHESVRDSLENILTSIRLIQERFKNIHTPNDFLLKTDDLFTLDAVAMRLQIIGENVKSLSKLDPELLDVYSRIEWRKLCDCASSSHITMAAWTMRSFLIFVERTFLNCGVLLKTYLRNNSPRRMTRAFTLRW